MGDGSQRVQTFITKQVISKSVIYNLLAIFNSSELYILEAYCGNSKYYEIKNLKHHYETIGMLISMVVKMITQM